MTSTSTRKAWSFLFFFFFSQAGDTLRRALMTRTSTLKGGAAATIWHTYCTAAAPFTAPREMSAAKPEPAAQ